MRATRVLLRLGLLAVVVAVCVPAALGGESSLEPSRPKYDVSEAIVLRYVGSHASEDPDLSLHLHIVPTFGEVKVAIWNRYLGRGSVHGLRGTVSAGPLSVPGVYEARLVVMRRSHLGMVEQKVLARAEFEVGESWPDYPTWVQDPIQFVRGIELFQPDKDPGPGRHCWSHVLPEAHRPTHGLDHRLLLVFGPDILRSAGPVVTADATLSYRKLYRGTFNDEVFQDQFATLIERVDQRWSRKWKGRRKTDDILEDDVVLLSVQVGAGTPAGLKTIRFDARVAPLPPLHWMLRDAANPGTLYFSRLASTAEFTDVDSVFIHDRIKIRLDARYPVAAERIRVDVCLDGRPATVVGRDDGIVELKRRQGSKRNFVSATLALIKPSTPKASIPKGMPSILIKPGKILGAFVHPYGPVHARGPASARVFTTPADVDGLWLQALIDAARSAKVDPGAYDLRTARARLELALLPVTIDAPVGEIPAKVGDVAAMLLLKRGFVAALERVKAKTVDIRERARHQRTYLHGFREVIRPLAQTANSPFGQLDVVSHEGVMADMHVAFWNVYDEGYLERRFRGLYSDQLAWQDQATAEVLDIYLAAIEEALAHARGLGDEDWRGLLELTGLHFEPVRDRMLPTLLRLKEDPREHLLTWVPDGIARPHVMGLAALGKKLREREATAKAISSLALAAASLTVLGPEILIVRVVTLAAGAMAVAEVLALQIPEFLESRGAARRALGAIEVLGHRRLEYARARVTPWYMLALDIVTSVAGVAGDALAVGRLGRVSLTMKKVPRYVELLDELGDLERLTHRQKEVVVFIAGEAKRLQRGLKLSLDSPIFPFATPGVKDALRRLGPRLERFQEILWRAKQPLICPARIPRSGAYRLRSGDSLDGLLIDGGIGRGRSAQVYSLVDYESDALKVLNGTMTDDAARRVLSRVRETAALLDKADVPYLKVKRLVPRATSGRPYTYWVQERLPRGARVYHYAHRELPYETLGATRTREIPFGVLEFDGRPLPRGQQHALLELLTKIHKKGLVSEDGHLANFYFKQVDGRWRAGVLDLERIVPMSEDFTRRLGPDGLFALREMQRSPGLECDIYRNSIWSLKGSTLPADAAERLAAGRHIYPDPEFFMAKMLEYKWMIRYDRSTGRWMDSVLEMDVVAEYFPAIRRHIDVDFR